jgi:ABC-type multidrug transport system ATPase subunit/pSer/pThr/pTyr-binding forkhead associated (FHA) protein
MMLEARLTIEGNPRAVTLSGAGPWLLGRAADADVAFPGDQSCSREQARVVRVDEGFAIEHLSRTAPTSVDGDVVYETVALRDGARITFGVQRLLFTLIEAEFTEATMIGRVETIMPTPDLLALDRSLTVGRQDYLRQVVFDHPAVSRRHAAFDVADGSVTVRDLGSTNGTFVNGARIDRPRVITAGDRVDIGPFQLTFDGKVLNSASRAGNAELVVSGVGFDVRMAGDPVRILDGATFEIKAREFVCIIGASGSGKSTLMNILAGRARPSTGEVMLNGTNLHNAFDAMKQDIAFVPQQDVLHEQLTLRQALDYAAQLRLPRDTSRAQRHAIVETAARSVDLFERLDTKIGLLSGGQKKRASLASEILNRPSLLFLDEVTSGLDESTDWEIMRLLRRLADEGMTIVVVTHTLANVEAFCHKVVCMGRGGHTTFVGSPDAALGYFGVQRLGEIFNRIEEDGARFWRARFEDTGLATVIAPTTVRQAAIAPATVARRKESPWRVARLVVRQFGILTHRNTRLLLADRRTLVMAAVQSCLIGGLMGYAFGTFGTGQEAVGGRNALLFLLGLTSIWLGCNGASKDIVGELVIYKRERDINLSTAAFVGSKYVVTGLFTVLQLAVVFVLTALLAERIPGRDLPQFGILVAGGLAGTAIGLVISAFSNTRDQATTIVPLALVPQIILAGILVPHLPRPAELLAKVAVSSYWLTEAMKSVYIAADGPIRVISAKTGMPINMTAEPTSLGVLIVVAHALVFLLITYMAALLRHGSGRRRA